MELRRNVTFGFYLSPEHESVSEKMPSNSVRNHGHHAACVIQQRSGRTEACTFTEFLRGRRFGGRCFPVHVPHRVGKAISGALRLFANFGSADAFRRRDRRAFPFGLPAFYI